MKPTKPTLRRFSWCRVHHELLSNPLWDLVARMARVDVDRVEAFVVRLDIFASANVPRGTVIGFNVAALAARWNCSAEALERVYAALEDPAVGWIEQDHVASFWERNPDLEDATAAQRQQRRRARLKEEREAARMARAENNLPKPVTRDSVTVTTRSDQIRSQEAEIPKIEQGQRGASLSAAEREAMARLAAMSPTRQGNLPLPPVPALSKKRALR